MRTLFLFIVSAFTALAAPIGYNTQPIPGLVGWWTFNEGSGTTPNDYSGDNATGLFVNTPAWNQGLIGTCLNFAGGTNGVSIKSLAVSNAFATANYTISLWCNGTNMTGLYGFVFNKADPTHQLQTYFTTAGKFAYELYDGTHDNLCTASNSLGAGWHLFTSVLNNNTMRIYTDNYLNSPAVANTTTTTACTSNCTISYWPVNATHRFTNQVDDVRIYNRVLTLAEIQQLYNGGAGSQQ